MPAGMVHQGAHPQRLRHAIPAAGALADTLPAGGRVAGARVVGMDEGLQQQGAHAIAVIPVRGRRRASWPNRWEARWGTRTPGKIRKRALATTRARLPRRVAFVPADPLVAGLEGEAGRLTGGGAEVTLGAVEQVAQLRPTQGLIPQGVLGHELAVSGAFRSRGHDHEIEGAQGGTARPPRRPAALALAPPWPVRMLGGGRRERASPRAGSRRRAGGARPGRGGRCPDNAGPAHWSSSANHTPVPPGRGG